MPASSVSAMVLHEPDVLPEHVLEGGVHIDPFNANLTMASVLAGRTRIAMSTLVLSGIVGPPHL